MTAFQTALVDSVLKEYAAVPAEQSLPEDFSPAFQQWAAAFLPQQTPGRIRLRKAVKFILIAAILMALLAGTAMAVPAIREGLIGYFVTTRADSYGITFDPEAAATAPREIETVYALGWIPEGYTLYMDAVDAAGCVYFYTKDGKFGILFSQGLIPIRPTDDSWGGFGDPSHPKKQVLLGDYLVTVIDTGESFIFLWTDNSYFYHLSVREPLDYDTAVQLFHSVYPVGPLEPNT